MTVLWEEADGVDPLAVPAPSVDVALGQEGVIVLLVLVLGRLDPGAPGIVHFCLAMEVGLGCWRLSLDCKAQSGSAMSFPHIPGLRGGRLLATATSILCSHAQHSNMACTGLNTSHCMCLACL